MVRGSRLDSADDWEHDDQKSDLFFSYVRPKQEQTIKSLPHKEFRERRANTCSQSRGADQITNPVSGLHDETYRAYSPKASRLT